jgi:hypothetical protein
MNITSARSVTAPIAAPSTRDRLAVAAAHMYAAEITLHAARQAGVDSWVVAAYAKLHDAIAEHTAASFTGLAA